MRLILGAIAALAIVGVPDVRAGNVTEGAIEDIVVTARRLQEPSQQAGLSLIAFSGDALSRRGYHDISRLDESVVNLQFDPSTPISGSSNSSAIYIRGVGQSDFLLTNDPGVGVYLDGVYISRSVGGVLSLLDIERTEVLRGPQGDLYGRNTIGGAINVISRLPEETIGGSAEVTAGNLDRIDVSGTLNYPILDDTLLSRISVSSRERDGYMERLIGDEDTGKQNQQSMRLSLSWLPNGKVSTLFSLDGTRARNESIALTNPWLGDPLLYGRGALTDLYNENVAPDNDSYYDARWLSSDTLKTYGTGPSESNLDIWGTALTVDVDLGQINLRSISSYRDLDGKFGRDPDGSPYTIVHTLNHYQHRQASQEFQLLDHSPDNKLHWLTGLYFFAERGTDAFTAPLVEGLYQAIGVPFSLASKTRIDNFNGAVFGNLSYQLTDTWNVNGGIRYSYERKRTTINAEYLDTGEQLIENPDDRETFTDVAPRLSLEYLWRENRLLYVTVAKGFKSGGFTGRYVEATEELMPFDPEKLISYEVGIKSDWLDNRLQLNAAAFYSDYRDIQILIFDGIAPQTRNAAKGEIQGLELEGTYLPLPGLSLKTGLGYIDARYTELDTGVDGLTIPLTRDDMFVNTPEWSANISVIYSWVADNGNRLEWQIDYSYTDQIANDAINTEELIQDDVQLVNTQVRFSPTNQHWQAVLFGRNLGDKKYIVSGAADKPTFGTVAAVYAPPRQWGVTVSYSF